MDGFIRDETQSNNQSMRDTSDSQQGNVIFVNWFNNNTIDEVAFCEWFCDRHPVKYVGGLFYNIDGVLSKDKLTGMIVEYIKTFIKVGLVRKANQIVDVLKYETMCDELPRDDNMVHFKNGTYLLKKGFFGSRVFCTNRLPIRYNPEATTPVTWLSFLKDLLYEEDIPTLQEFMGYTFIPTTKAQAMLILVGSGGEGKSRIGVVCRNLLGDNMNFGSLSKLTSNRFCAADQEGKLLFIDDDMKMEALTDTGTLKSIVTMEDKMDLERKGQQSYQGYLYTRIMVFGNGALSSLYDKSDGFYRRQIVIRVKEKPADRIDDKNLSDKLAEETQGIALWCLEGLKRLYSNGFHFTISERTKRNQAEMRRDEDSIMDFFESDGYIAFDEKAITTTKDLYEAYRRWGDDNVIKIRSESSFSKELRQRAEKLGITYMKNATLDNKTARGYKGIYAIHTQEHNPFVGSTARGLN